MLDSVAALLTYQAGIYFATGTAPARMGNRHPTHRAVRDVRGVRRRLRARRRQRRAVAALLRGRRARRRDERFATNRQRVDGVRRAAADPRRRGWPTQPRAHWIERLTAAGVPCGSVRDLREVFADPQLAGARDDVRDVEHADDRHAAACSGMPVKLSDTPGVGAHARRRRSASTPTPC